jgi:ABC-type glycerol-3-phosphate transport system permease component
MRELRPAGGTATSRPTVDSGTRTASARVRRLLSFVARQGLFLSFCALAGAILYPIFFTFNAALKSASDFRTDRIGLAIPPDFGTLSSVWQFIDFPRSIFNSFLISVGTVLVVWCTASLAAYSFTKLRWRGQNLAFLMVIGSLLVPVQVVLAPLFIVLRDIGLLNTQPGLILTLATFQTPVATFMFAAYFRALPNNVIEAARVDGASTLQTLRLIVLPLSKPALATVGAISFVWSWNEVLIPIIVLQDRALQGLTLRAAQLAGNFTSDPGSAIAGVALSILPMIAVFMLAQRHLVRAVTVGATR